MRNPNYLFTKDSIFDVRQRLERQISEEINQFQSDYLLKVSIDGLIEHLIDKYSMNCPILQRDKIEIVEHGETRIQVKDYGQLAERTANFYKFAIPFSGDKGLFDFTPSTSNYNPPSAQVNESELNVYLTNSSNNIEEVKAELEKILSSISLYLTWLRKDVNEWNGYIINTFIPNQVNSRRQKLLQDERIVASLGFPIRKRKNIPETYSAPVRRKKIAISRPTVTSEPFEPEPALEEKEYDFILKTLSNMVTVMERSPKAFSGMEEEDLRNHFLVHLNGIYEGQATGETFNYEGKTDILIRVNGKNIFIAECKFWSGAKGLINTLNQILNYLSWRDTKVAILLFNRNKEFGRTLLRIPKAIEQHPNFKRHLNYHNETGFRFVLHSNIDKNRELIVTLLAFDVPK